MVLHLKILSWALIFILRLGLNDIVNGYSRGFWGYSIPFWNFEILKSLESQHRRPGNTERWVYLSVRFEKIKRLFPHNFLHYFNIKIDLYAKTHLNYKLTKDVCAHVGVLNSVNAWKTWLCKSAVSVFKSQFIFIFLFIYLFYYICVNKINYTQFT